MPGLPATQKTTTYQYGISGVDVEKEAYKFIIQHGNKKKIEVGQSDYKRNCTSMATTSDQHILENINVWQLS